MSAPAARHDSRAQAEQLGRARKALPEHLKRQAEDDPSIFDAWQAAFDDAVETAHADAGEPVRDSAADIARTNRERTAGRARGAGRPSAAPTVARARAAGRRQAKRGRSGARAAEATFDGAGTPVGVAVAMFALVLLYVLLTRSSALSSLVANVSGWLTRFMSPAHPLF